VSLSVWVRPRKNGGWIEIDFGAVFVNDRPQHAWRVVGPALDWEGWREVTFDLPVYPAPNQPAAENDRKRDPDAQGPANYPMRLDAILLRGMASCAIDGITLRTWSGRKNPIQVLTWSSLPGNLVPPGDPIHVLVQNTSLHQPCDRLLRWQTVDLAFRPYARGEMRFHLPPGQSDALAVSTAGLPKGVFGLRIQVLEGEKVTYRNDWDEEMSRERLGQRFVVYRPALPETDLVHIQAHLRDGHAVEKELGKAEARVEMQWHNSYPEMRDGIQPREGLWQWHDYDARVRAGATAGKELVGRLGLTAAWASPVGRYDAFHNRDWVGSPFTPPMRSVDWERYVYTVVKRYRENVSLWEIWNEPDDPAFNMTAGEFCGKVLRVACQAARNADPNCKVLLGGISRERLLPFLGDFLKSGGHELVDAVGIHPVVDPMSPERAFLDDLLVEAQQMAEQAGAGGKLWITELGWNVGGRDDVSELEQAQYLARALVLARFAGIRRVLIDLHDSQWNEKSSGVLFQPRYEPRFIQYRLGALAFKQARSILGDSAEPVSEVCLRDRRYHLARAYLFRTAEDYVLAAWRESGTAAMPRVAEEAYDMVGNRLPPDRRDVELSPSPIYFHIPLCDSASLRRSLERLPLEYEDAEGSEWKRRLTCFVDVGDPADEAKSGYEVSGKTVIVTKSALYPNKRSLKDSGRVIHGTETFVVPVSDFGSQDLILCRRVDYNAASLGVKDQKCDVRVDGQQTGVWHVPGQDRVRSWRDTCFIVPNRFLVGHTTVKVSLTALDGPFTTFELVAGPMKPGIVYLSDWYPLVDTQGWIGQARADTSFIHSPITVHARKFLKGLGVHAPSQLVYGLNRQFRTFVFLPGVDDVTEGTGSVRFKVILDGRLAYDSQRVDAFAQIGPQETNVENVSLLQLIVEDGEDGKENDVADWCDARLTY
jgi:GH35 family endo-1,4-beta-xylanase